MPHIARPRTAPASVPPRQPRFGAPVVRAGTLAHRVLAVVGPTPTGLVTLAEQLGIEAVLVNREARRMTRHGLMTHSGRTSLAARPVSDALSYAITPEGVKALALLGPVA